jgi:hypothetical protein
MLLIFPPVAKPCEPPAGIAKLVGALKAHGISCELLDANLEGLLWLAGQPDTENRDQGSGVREKSAGKGTWTRRALNNREKNLAALRSPLTYQSPDRYSRAVRDVQRVLEAGHNGIGLADYQHKKLSPVRSRDLLYAAEHPEENPFFPWFSSRLPELLAEKSRSSVVGFSLNYLSQALTTFGMIGFLRKEFPELKIVLGGGLVTSWMKQRAWNNPFEGLADCLIAGPGEGPLLRYLGFDDGKITRAMPDYTALSSHDYFSPGFILPYSASSGCFWNKCSFCPEKAEDNPYVPVPVQEAVSDLLALTAKTKPVMIHLLDNAISPALMHELIRRPPGAPWYGFARIGKEFLDLDFCLAVKRSGCTMLKLGLESGDQKVLDDMHKGLELETASRALKNLKRAGIATYIYLLFGTPTETLTEARKTLQFTIDHADAITFLNLAIFNMSACGPEAEAYGTEPFYDGDLSLYTGFKHPHGWDRKAVRRFLEGEFKRHPTVARILRNDPPVFTSNHAALFCS